MMPNYSGVVCANFGCRVNGIEPCFGAWHAKCFHQAKEDKFPVLSLSDLEESLIDERFIEEGDKDRFKCGRDGDHLMTPFQCENCHFYNLKGRERIKGCSPDDLLAVCIRRATLDSFWSRERSTVASNLGEVKRYAHIQDLFGLGAIAFPTRGPFGSNDTMGMEVACAILVRSLDGGRNAKHVQYETVRKLRSMYSNYVHTCPGGTGDTFMSDLGSASMVSASITNQLWFKRFMIGCHRRMGDVWMPDAPVTKEVILCCLRTLEMKWEVFGNDPVGRKKVSVTACILLAGFFGGLRGEEVNRVDLGGMRQYWKEGVAAAGNKRHVPLVLAGTFKGETGLKFFTQPLAPVTKGGVKIQVWFSRVIQAYEAEEIVTGPMFRNQSKYKRASIAEMDQYFHPLLQEIQRDFPNLIPDTVAIRDSYSIYRSLRRGATSEAQNQGIPQEVIQANNRWRKFSKANGLTPGMSMMERYSDAKASVPTLVRFSLNLI